MKRIKEGFYTLFVITLLAAAAFNCCFGDSVRAYSEMTSSSFKIKDSALDTGGGTGTSANFKMDQAVGQEFQDKKTGSSYKIYEGIMYYSGALSIVCGSSVSIPTVSPGTPQSVNDICTVTTESANGYKLYTYESKDLEHTTAAGTYITPSSLGSYDSPTPWDTGTDVGLGFSLCGVSAEGKWDSGANFSSFVSGAAGLINDYSSSCAGGTNITVTYQLDVVSTQRSGDYQNEVYYYVTTNWF